VGPHLRDAYGIALECESFSEPLTRAFHNALLFVNEHTPEGSYWVLRINSPGGSVLNVLHPILDMLDHPTTKPFFTVAVRRAHPFVKKLTRVESGWHRCKLRRHAVSGRLEQPARMWRHRPTQRTAHVPPPADRQLRRHEG
jgi:hypothetical protein